MRLIGNKKYMSDWPFIKDGMEQFLPKVPGIIGSLGAMLWIQGSWPRKVAMLVLGTAASAYGTADFAAIAGITEGLAGFIVGLFSMTAADWLFRAWDTFLLGPLLNEWARKKLGIPPK